VKIFVGIDWGSKSHAVCVLDEQGRKLFEQEIRHHGDDVQRFVSKLRELAGGDMSNVSAAMEAPQGVMVEVLLDSGAHVYSLNPKQLDRFRDRHSVSGAKDDDLDAYVLARSLQTDPALFRLVSLASPALMQLSALSRSYEATTAQVLSLSNQVCELLRRYYPQMLELGDWHEQPWLWLLFKAAPTPQRAAKLSRLKINNILVAKRIRRVSAEHIQQKLRETALPVAAGVADAAALQVSKLLPMLEVAHEQRCECCQQMKALLKSFSKENDSPENTHHDAALLLSLPGIGVRNGAVMLTEARVALQTRDYQALRRLAGVAPVSQRTGGRSKRPQVHRRQACNHRLREAFYHCGRVASQRDPRTQQHYRELRARGHSHGRAVRGVVDRLLKVLVAVLHSAQPYDPAKRAAVVRRPPIAA
jgi:transposase